MAGQEINQYATERSELGDLDYMDIDYWTGSVFKTAKIRGSVINGSNGGVWSQIGDSTILQNSSVETSILGSGVGTLTIPRDTWIVGQSYKFVLSGRISTKATNEPFQFWLKSGSTILTFASLFLELITFGVEGKYFEINLQLTCRAIGGIGVAVLESQGRIDYVIDTNSALKTRMLDNKNFTTFDTTIDNTLDLTAKWTTADPNNTIQSKMGNFRKTY